MKSHETVKGVALLVAELPEKQAVLDAADYVDALFNQPTEVQEVGAPMTTIAPAARPRPSRAQEPGTAHR